MLYKHCPNNNFEDFSSGRVILHKSGFPNFPVRLALEIFCRCLGYLKRKNEICVYDPCCGSGYMMTVIGLFNFGLIQSVVCSDCNDEVLDITKRNLDLLSVCGMDNRIKHLEELYKQFNKTSHQQAIESAKTLKGYIKGREIHRFVFNADILISRVLENKDFKADIVFTDIPYNRLTLWQNDEEKDTGNFLDNLLPVLKPDSVIAVCSGKQQKIHTKNFIRLEKQQIGKRKFEIFTQNASSPDRTVTGFAPNNFEHGVQNSVFL
jgi:16S rRNA G966 N2-methylase RsmD